MLSKIITLALIGFALGTQQIKDQSLQKVYDERIPNTEYHIYSNQTLTLTYDAYPGVFAMDLRKKIVKGTDKFYESENYESFQEDAGTNEQANGCVAFQRQLVTSNNLGFSLPSSDDTYFTDIAVLGKQDKSFVIRNDFVLFEIFMYRDEQRDNVKRVAYPGNHTSIQNLLEPDTQDYHKLENNPWLVVEPETQRVFIITIFGATSFDGTKNLTETLEINKEEMFKKRQRIYDVHYNKRHKALILAAGTEGIDIYKVNGGHLEFWMNYGEKEIGMGSVNVVDVDSDEEGNKLYILDQMRGFTYLHIDSIEVPRVSKFHIPISRGSAFDHKKNTFLFIAQNIYNQDYAVEVFVDFIADSFFNNRFYEDEMQLYDVVMFDNYAVLVGYDAHKLIFHSLYSGFINTRLEHHTIFTEPELVKVQEYEWNEEYKHHQIVGLGRYEFKTFKVEYLHPRIKCHANNNFKQTFLLAMNSTGCRTKESLNDRSQFSQCNIHHAFYLNVEEVFLSTSSKIWIVVAVIFTFIIIFSMACSLYYCWQRWGRQIQMLDNQIIDLKKQEKYGNLAEHNENQNIQGEDA